MVAERTTRLMTRMFPGWQEETSSTDNPARDWALRYAMAALDVDEEAGNMEQARGLLRGALSRGADPPTIFRTLVALERRHQNIAAAWACFEEWRRSSAGGGCVGDTDFWLEYTWFEMEHGTPCRARAVAQGALAACPRDPKLYALYAYEELCSPSGRAWGRARVVFGAGTVRWLVDKVERYRQRLRAAARRFVISSVAASSAAAASSTTKRKQCR